MNTKITCLLILSIFLPLSASENNMHILRKDILATVCLDYKSQNKSYCGSSLYNCRIIGHSHKLDAYSLVRRNLPATLLDKISTFKIDTINKEKDGYVQLKVFFNKKIEESRTIICSPGMTFKENYITYDVMSIMIDNKDNIFQQRVRALFETDKLLGYDNCFFVHILNEEKPYVEIYSLDFTEEQIKQIIQEALKPVALVVEEQLVQPVVPTTEKPLTTESIWVDLGVVGLGVI